MRIIAVLFLTAITAAAQDKAETLSQSLKNEIARNVREHKFEARRPAPNEVKSGKVTYSGIAVQFARTRHPLQLLNPAAPAKYGSAEQNVVLDPITRRSTGLKIFSIKF